MHEIWPTPTALFSEWTIPKLYNMLQRIQSLSWSSCSDTPKKRKHRCDLSARVMAIADAVIRLAKGSQLKDFDLN